MTSFEKHHFNCLKREGQQYGSRTFNTSRTKPIETGFFSGEQQGEDREIGIGEKAKNLEENFQGHQNVQQQQRSLQAGSQSQDVQKALEVDAPPDPQKDFMGYIQWLGKTLYKQGALLSEQPPAMSPESEQLHAFYQQSVAAVKQKHHDFDQAADFIYDTRAKQLAAFSSLYPEMADPNVVDAVIGNELKQILHDCAKKNQNPAEVIYAIAQKLVTQMLQIPLVKIFRKGKILHVHSLPITA